MTDFKLLSGWTLMHENVPEPSWIIPGWLPRGQAARIVFGGPPKSRKSTLALEMAVSLATNAPFLGHVDVEQGDTCGVLYVQEENSTAMMRRDLAAILRQRGVAQVADPDPTLPKQTWAIWNEDYTPTMSRLDLLIQSGFRLNEADHLEWLTSKIQSNGYRYVFLDSLYRLVPGFDLDKGWQASVVLDILDNLRHRTGVSVVVIHHAGKSRNDSGMAGDRLMHSTYLRAWYDMLVFSEAIEHDTIRVATESRELAPEPDSHWQQTERGVWTPVEPPDKGGGEETKLTKKGRHQRNIRDLLTAGPMRPSWLPDPAASSARAIAEAIMEHDHTVRVTKATFTRYVSEVLRTLEEEKEEEEEDGDESV